MPRTSRPWVSVGLRTRPAIGRDGDAGASISGPLSRKGLRDEVGRREGLPGMAGLGMGDAVPRRKGLFVLVRGSRPAEIGRSVSTRRGQS